jgi:hypothetical protein
MLARCVGRLSLLLSNIPLFEELERQGFECLLISSRSLRRVAGQKTDVEDA